MSDTIAIASSVLSSYARLVAVAPWAGQGSMMSTSLRIEDAIDNARMLLGEADKGGAHAATLRACAERSLARIEEDVAYLAKNTQKDARVAWAADQARVDVAIGSNGRSWYKGSYRRAYANGAISKGYYVNLENGNAVHGNYRCHKTDALHARLMDAADAWFASV